MYALVSTLDDQRGTFIALYPTREDAIRAGANYLREKHPDDVAEIRADAPDISDEDLIGEMVNWLGLTEWYFVHPCEQPDAETSQRLSDSLSDSQRLNPSSDYPLLSPDQQGSQFNNRNRS